MSNMQSSLMKNVNAIISASKRSDLAPGGFILQSNDCSFLTHVVHALTTLGISEMRMLFFPNNNNNNNNQDESPIVFEIKQMDAAHICLVRIVSFNGPWIVKYIDNIQTSARDIILKTEQLKDALKLMTSQRLLYMRLNGESADKLELLATSSYSSEEIRWRPLNLFNLDAEFLDVPPRTEKVRIIMPVYLYNSIVSSFETLKSNTVMLECSEKYLSFTNDAFKQAEENPFTCQFNLTRGCDGSFVYVDEHNTLVLDFTKTKPPPSPSSSSKNESTTKKRKNPPPKTNKKENQKPPKKKKKKKKYDSSSDEEDDDNNNKSSSESDQDSMIMKDSHRKINKNNKKEEEDDDEESSSDDNEKEEDDNEEEEDEYNEAAAVDKKIPGVDMKIPLGCGLLKKSVEIGAGFSKVVIIKLSASDQPVEIQYKNDNGMIQFYIAPRSPDDQ